MNISKKQLIDQSSHFAVAVLAIAPVLAAPGFLSAAFAGFIIGVVRELTEEGTKVNLESFKAVARSTGSRIDIGFWTLGGAVAGLLFS